ncbi:MAG TPA: 4Fe-4S dicluster domain-containing protein, partial [Dissulfurispiraceae bacterium]|nr:4Fe-4S dicluster domain-containing protein [Dissulfurispiraceae bacterium]
GQVRLEHVTACKKRFLNSMDDEVRGYQIESCFGPGGCPNRAVDSGQLLQTLEAILGAENLKDFLRERVGGPLKMHHEFRITVSDCPNACSRPQIADIGIIGASLPGLSGEPCTMCGACTEACKEEALSLTFDDDTPLIDIGKCLACGQCIAVCPTGTLREEKRGFRILLGGKLGRHPQLGREIRGIYPAEDTVRIVKQCIELYREKCLHGERFGEVLNRIGMEEEKEYDFLMQVKDERPKMK